MSIGAQMIVVLKAFVERRVSLVLGHPFEFSWLDVSPNRFRGTLETGDKTGHFPFPDGEWGMFRLSPIFDGTWLPDDAIVRRDHLGGAGMEEQ